MHLFESLAVDLFSFTLQYHTRLSGLSETAIAQKRNSQNRNIRQIVGHMVDSASNNTHRIVHLQYQKSPLVFPNYATEGNNDRWIAIQNYEEEEWESLVQLWKYSHLHIIHVIRNVNTDKLNQEWICAPDEKITLKVMIEDFPRHFHLHIHEIEELLNES